MDRVAWQVTVHGVVKSWTRLSDSLSLSFLDSFGRALEPPLPRGSLWVAIQI